MGSLVHNALLTEPCAWLSSEMFMELYREEKKEEGDRGGQEDKRGVGMESFDELLSINVPWSQEFSGVLRIWT